MLLGRSWQGRAIEAYEVGNPAGTPVLVVGCIHGDETGGIAVARALEHLAPRDLDLWIVPDLNPDGVAAGTRRNAHGVDLNRNFPWHWRPLGGVYASGPRPLSEREARIARALITRLRPHLYHLVPPAPRPGLGLGREPEARVGLRASLRAALPSAAAARGECGLLAEQRAPRDDGVRGRAPAW